MTKIVMSRHEEPAPARSVRLNRLRGLSTVLARLSVLFAALLPVLMLAYWWLTPTEALFRQAGLVQVPPAWIGFPMRLAGFALSMIPLAALVLGLLSARGCFTSFAAGRVFSSEAARGLRGLALGVGASALLSPLAGAALSLLLSTQSPVGMRSVVFSVGSDSLLSLLFAAMVAAIASVLVEAADIAAENEQFV
ncbi:MAG TPA: DUF2975 domain-containing protein [Kaistia sp.]|nr:DUF2975 domain-containing protein [Kaistia sp.]